MYKKSLLIMLSSLVLLSLSLVMVRPQERQESKSTQIMGTLVDLSCYAKGGFLTNDHGDTKKCGSMCATGGLPVAVVDAEENVHFLAVPAPGYAPYIGDEVRMTGTQGKHAAVFIPEKLEIKENGKWVEKKLPKTMM